MPTDLLSALRLGDLARVASALRDGADPNAVYPDLHGWRPLHVAIEAADDGAPHEAAILLLRSGADVDGWDTHHEAPPLLMALFRRQRPIVHALLAAGADPTVVGAEGDSPLRWCVAEGDLAMAALLLAAGADRTIDAAGGARGTNALGQATRQLDLDLMRLLLQHGADPRHRDANHQSAFDHLSLEGTRSPDTWQAAEALLRSFPPTADG